MCCVKLALKGLASAGKGCLCTGFPRSLTDGYAMLMSPVRAQQLSMHCCHYPRYMGVRMREVQARPWVGVCVPLALSLHYFQGNFR